VSKVLSAGYRFSRACFLSFGGALMLIAIVPLAVSLPDLRGGDWPADEASQLYSTTSHCAAYGLIFLATALVLFKSKRWAAYLAAIAGASALILMVLAWSEEVSDRAGFGIVLLVPAVPLSLTLIWALAQAARELRDRKKVNVPRNQIA
jgi:hypothetical protein